MSDLQRVGLSIAAIGLLAFLSCTGGAVPDDPLVTTSRNVSVAVMLVGLTLTLAVRKRGDRG